jgi:hypothetical protein
VLAAATFMLVVAVGGKAISCCVSGAAGGVIRRAGVDEDE